jgi:hypothetical protein
MRRTRPIASVIDGEVSIAVPDEAFVFAVDSLDTPKNVVAAINAAHQADLAELEAERDRVAAALERSAPQIIKNASLRARVLELEVEQQSADDAIRQLDTELTELRAAAGTHLYVSTACQHGKHDVCREQCKYCDSPCLCPCHRTTGKT